MESLISSICLLFAVIIGYRMGKGQEFRIDFKKMKKLVLNEEQEAELQNKIFKEKKVKISG